ncbi:MAG: cysteine desulfurase family protein, partial [Nanoarchaeota archaeon]
MVKEIYFDAAATTRVYPEVVKAMNGVMLDEYGNASSAHALGDRASKLIINSRANIARALGARTHEIYFTSGTTESNNWVFSGLAHTNSGKKKILISSIEHPSIRETAELFKGWGYNIVEIPVNSEGFVDLNFIEKNIDSETLFVSVIHGNNIFGTIQNLKKIGAICKRNGVLFHTDAAQSFGKIKILVHDWNIDLLSASAHKISGPKGVGLLYVREGIKFSPLIYGGGQERGLRSGTEN